MGAYPQTADWNEDGKKDLLVGDSNGIITLYLNTGTSSAPVLTNSGQIQAAGTQIDVGSRAAPAVTDWNNDGKKDLVIGTDLGSIRLYLNVGTNAAPVFNSYTTLMMGTTPISHYRSSPEVWDLDGDGKKDLLLGDWYGYMYFYSNTGTDANPQFSTEVRLRPGDTPNLLWVDRSARFDLADWDDDGDMDVIVGEWNAYVNFFRNITVITSVKPDDPVSDSYSLQQNFPNPFNPSTTILYILPVPSKVNLSVYNITGQLVKVLVDESKASGTHRVDWNVDDLRSGVYFYKLTAGAFSDVKKCLIVK